MLIITPEAYHKLKQRTKVELLEAIFGSAAPQSEDPDFDPSNFDWEGRVDLTPGEVEEFMATLGRETTQALHVIAEHGPAVKASLLDATGIESYASFQRSTTRRVRSITGGKNNFLLAWDDWSAVEEGEGKYAVTNTTFRSLKIFFELD